LKDNIGSPTIEDGNIDSCAPWTGVSDPIHPRLPRFTSGAWSQAGLILPPDADGLYLTTRGAFSSGNLYVSESNETKDISVKVFVHHHGVRSFTRASVCRLSRDDGQIGVGIFVRSVSAVSPSTFLPTLKQTARNWQNHWPTRARNNVHFVVTVEIPSTRGEVRHMSSFHADLPTFALATGDLTAFHFNDFVLKSTQSSIEVEVLILNYISVQWLKLRRASLPII
jgi:hypothetical protein